MLNDIKQISGTPMNYVARQHFQSLLVQPMQYSLYQPWLKGYNGQFLRFRQPPAGRRYISSIRPVSGSTKS